MIITPPPLSEGDFKAIMYLLGRVSLSEWQLVDTFYESFVEVRVMVFAICVNQFSYIMVFDTSGKFYIFLYVIYKINLI